MKCNLYGVYEARTVANNAMQLLKRGEEEKANECLMEYLNKMYDELMKGETNNEKKISN